MKEKYLYNLIKKKLTTNNNFSTINKMKKKYHQSQTQSFNDSLVLVDYNDNVISPISKIEGFY